MFRVREKPGTKPLALEQGQNGLRLRVGNRQRLDTQLLLDLQGLQSRAFNGQVGIHEITDTLVQAVHQLAHETVVRFQLLDVGTQIGQRLVDVLQAGLDRSDRRRGQRHRAQRSRGGQGDDRAADRHVLRLQRDRADAVGVGQELDAARDRAVQDVGTVELGVLENAGDLVQQGLAQVDAASGICHV